MAASLRWGSGTAASSASTSAGLSPAPLAAGAADRAGAVDRGDWLEGSVPPITALASLARSRHCSQINGRRGVIEQLLRAVDTNALAHTCECLQNLRKSLSDGRRSTGDTAKCEHGVIQLLDVFDQVLPFECQSFHFLFDGRVGRFEVADTLALDPVPTKCDWGQTRSGCGRTSGS